MPEIWVITFYVAQDDKWMMEGRHGRDECRARVGRLAAMWPAVQHVTAELMPTNRR